MARELPNPEQGTPGQIPKIQSDGSYGLAADESGSGSGGGSPDTTYISPGETWVPAVENASPGDTIYFLPGTHKDTTHSDTNEGPVLIDTHNITIHVAAGATVMARDGLNEEERFIRVISDDVTFQGRGTLDGNAAMSDGMAGVPTGLGHEHIIDIFDRFGTRTPENILVTGLTLQNAGGGDGIYLNRARHVTIQNVHIDAAVRNGISIINAEDIFINNFLIENTKGAPPQTGLAFEQNGEGETMNRIMVSNGVSKNNNNHGAYMNNHFTNQTFGTSSVENISLQNVTVEGNAARGFSWHGTAGGERVHFDTCHAARNGKSGFYLAGNGHIRLDNCSARSNGTAGAGNAHESGIVCEGDEGNGTGADVIVNGFDAYNHGGTQKHPGIAMAASRMRVIDARVGPHNYGQDGFRSSAGSTVEHHLVDVESGDAPAFTLDGSTVTSI